MDKLIIKNVSSLEKIMAEAECVLTETNCGSALLNEEFSYQIAYKTTDVIRYQPVTTLEVESELGDAVSVYCVKHVPVSYGAGVDADDGYIGNGIGMYPDVLEPYKACVPVSCQIFRALWVSVKPDESVVPGDYTIRVSFKSEGEIVGVSEFTLTVIGAVLPKLDIGNGVWMHTDCIADWHGCKVFSDEYWRLVDVYMQMASAHGVNMLLTPVITPALDTLVGAERPTVQLLDISFDGTKYTFGFDRLKQWMDLCRKNGIERLEIAPLFTQWGGEKAPKVVVEENGQEIVKFGWHTEALGDEYREFLSQMLPALTKFLEENWEKEKVYFRVTDEPTEEQIDHYGALRQLVAPLIKGFKHMDALADYALYERGFVDVPVVINCSMDNFLGKGVEDLWLYTCCEANRWNCANRFIAMPSRRSRIFGLQMYRYDIKGFLHWGYNFYYSRFSMQMVNPYICNDCEGAFPAGDAFVVYPVPGGVIPSLRLKVFNHGLQDIMAAKLLEKLAGKEAVLEIIEEKAPVAFNRYPETNEEFLAIREKINEAIKKYI